MKNNFFTAHTRIFVLISVGIMVLALALSCFGMGMNFGIDFTGGSILSYSVGESFDTADVETILLSAGFEDYIVTKASPSAASAALAPVPDETEETETEETAAESTFVPMLNLDKSAIEEDGQYDLEIRLALVDTAAGLDSAIASAVTAAYADAQTIIYDTVSNTTLSRYDTDNTFMGAYVMEFELGQAGFDAAALESAVSEALTQAEYNFTDVSVVAFASSTEEAAEATAVRVFVTIDDAASQVRALLEREMSAKYENFRFLTIDHVSATAGRDLIANALKALLIAFVCLLIYIAIRFDFFSGVAALAGLMHDVLIMCAFMVFFRGLYQINSSFIAAVLTIVGYSINNTIIIFDRIRETSKKPGFSHLPRKEITEISIRATLSRTVNTAITTLITLVTLYIFGIDTIREFAFPLIVGMIAGIYSSVMISGQFWAFMYEKHQASIAAKRTDKEASEAKAKAEHTAAKKARKAGKKA